jgi:pimeloyl-ACP methyl ester carboxylesterase
MTNPDVIPDAFPEAQPPVGGFEVRDLERGQVVRYNPTETRTDEGTGEPIIPILYFQGMNGDESLLPVLRALGERDKRPVIAVRHSTLPGSDKPIPETHDDHFPGAVIPEIDLHRAQDALAALDEYDVGKVDAIATSWGGSAMLVAMKKQPEVFRNVYGDDIAGQDGRGYVATHVDALRLGMNLKVRKLLGTSAVEIVKRPPKNERTPISTADKRTVQKAVARAQLHELLAHLGRETDIGITIGSDEQDKAFRTERVRAMMESTGAIQSGVKLVETRKGGHGIGANSQAIDNALEQLHAMELPEKI